MMMLVGLANKQYHDVYPDYADLLFLPDRSRIKDFYATMSFIYLYILLNS
jgi:hypothetical protein